MPRNPPPRAMWRRSARRCDARGSGLPVVDRNTIASYRPSREGHRSVAVTANPIRDSADTPAGIESCRNPVVLVNTSTRASAAPANARTARTAAAHTIPRMPPLKIAAIPGDGIGGEVLEAGLRVLDEVADIEVTTYPWGSDYYRTHGAMLPDDALETLQRFDAIYFGAVGSRDVPDHVTLWGLRLKICQGFDQWANVRPVKFYEGLNRDPTLDWIVVRENSEGEYAGLGGRQLSARGPGNEVAIQTSLFTEKGCERVIRFAFDLARSRPRKHLTSVTKSNAQQYAMVLWDETFQRVKGEYDDVTTDSELVDAMAARFVLRPETLDVVVASNLHGDILSDLGSALAGSLGLAASANLNPDRVHPSMFEPVHGSAPDIAGQGIANPLGAIGSGAMLLDHLGRPDLAARIRQAVAATIKDGIRTRDLGGTHTTADVTVAVIARL